MCPVGQMGHHRHMLGVKQRSDKTKQLGEMTFAKQQQLNICFFDKRIGVVVFVSYECFILEKIIRYALSGAGV